MGTAPDGAGVCDLICATKIMLLRSKDIFRSHDSLYSYSFNLDLDIDANALFNFLNHLPRRGNIFVANGMCQHIKRAVGALPDTEYMIHYSATADTEYTIRYIATVSIWI